MTDVTTDKSQTEQQIGFLRGLRQIRQLTPEPVPEAALGDILDVARWTGSARNIQPWDLIVIRAEAHGLGSAIGWFKGAPSDEAKRILGVPPERLLRTIMSIGYVDTAERSKRNRPDQPRKPLADFLHTEHW
jgi:nitroreductase